MTGTHPTSRFSLLIGVCLLGMLIAVSALGGLWLTLKAPGPIGEGARIWIPPGQGVSSISRTLKDHNLVHSARFFRLAVQLTGRSARLQAGEFDVPGGLSVLQLAEYLETATPVPHFVTVPEGATSSEVARLLAGAPFLAVDSSDFGPLEEGAFLPETYSYLRGEGAAAVLTRMRAAMNSALIDLWETRAANLPYDSPDDALILASIVEKETAVPAERTRIASVFINRLRRGMRLQSDPTVIYGRVLGDTFGRSITRSDLEDNNPYNTYKINGLPPTPIANPGRASLEAAMHPDDTDYLYFVADGSGGHVFAKSLEEHNKNVALWRAIERARRLSREQN